MRKQCTSDSGHIFSGDEFAALRRRGARVQRPLWASTGTKNPAYSDVLYAEELMGPETVQRLVTGCWSVCCGMGPGPISHGKYPVERFPRRGSRTGGWRAYLLLPEVLRHRPRSCSEVRRLGGVGVFRGAVSPRKIVDRLRTRQQQRNVGRIHRTLVLRSYTAGLW